MSNNKWPNNGSDIGGILKRKNPPAIPLVNNLSNLLIFGYGCRIFRDDEKAKFIDQGKHLISWMGNNSHKIDRYDVRATLSDLKPHEPPAGGYDNRLDYLTPEEKRAEELCEEERYYSLKHNEEEELMYQEEELKRLHQERSSSYGQVKFDYNLPSDTGSNNDEDDSKSEEPDEVYQPPRNFDIPISIALPETMKQHAIVEKTAKFISTQGPQMEILIKAKQSNNPQFEFLNQNNILNPYYKFVLMALKNGTYPKEEEQQQQQQQQLVQNLSENDKKLDKNITDSFSTTSIDQYSVQTSKLTIPTIQYKPSANCAYTQLISKIKGVPLPDIIDENAQNQIVTNSTDAATGRFPLQISTNQNSVENDKISSNNGVEIKKISSGLALAQCYSSGSESDDDDDNDDKTNEDKKNQKIITNTEPILNFPIPPENERNIIDKTAAYVSKNGKQFEETLKLKGDDRFSFLHDYDENHAYYLYKITGIVPSKIHKSNNSKTKNLAPVSFSIKLKDDNSVAIKPALPQETSDDESENKTTQANEVVHNPVNQNPGPVPISKLPEHVQKAIQLVENQLVAKSVKSAAAGAHAMMGMMASMSGGGGLRSRFDIDSSGNPINRQIINIPTINAQTILENQKELKRAEERVKDRLAQIAREKLGLISKEKQLQIERKKKAMAFLNQIKGSDSTSTINNDNKLITEKNQTTVPSSNDSDKESVHSIPISSYGGENDADDDNKDENCKSDYEYHENRRPSPFLDLLQNVDDDYADKMFSITKSISKKRRSRSRSRSVKRKKSKTSHSKKKSKKKSKSRSRSESRSSSFSPILKSHHRKRSSSKSSKKSKKRKRDRD